jgi:hypothetical protein
MDDPSIKPKPVIRWSFRANSKVDVPILMAIFGFFCGIAILLCPGRHSQGGFHDLSFNGKREAVEKLLDSQIAFLSQDTTNKKLIADIKFEKNKIEYFIIDSGFSFCSPYIRLDGDELSKALKNGDTFVEASFWDTCFGRYPIDKVLKNRIGISRSGSDLIPFFDQHSSFGYWFIVSIAQMSMWFMLFALVIGTAKGTSDIVEYPVFNFINSLRLTIMPFLVVGSFVVVLYFLLIRDTVVRDSYFMWGFNRRMYFYSIPGYFLAAVSFGVYLYIANKLEILNGFLAHVKVSKGDVNDIKYQQLKTAFQFVFFCTAVVLSVFTIWLGLLFTSVNDLEVGKFYHLSTGKQLLNYDFVYLLGMMHSVLLAIFYIPVQLQFNSLKLTKEDKSSNSGGKILKTTLDVLGSILITASPLITTVVQKLLAGL